MERYINILNTQYIFYKNNFTSYNYMFTTHAYYYTPWSLNLSRLLLISISICCIIHHTIHPNYLNHFLVCLYFLFAYKMDSSLCTIMSGTLSSHYYFFFKKAIMLRLDINLIWININKLLLLNYNQLIINYFVCVSVILRKIYEGSLWTLDFWDIFKGKHIIVSLKNNLKHIKYFIDRHRFFFMKVFATILF